MKAEASVVVLVQQPETAPAQGDNILRVYRNTILKKKKKKMQVLIKVVLIKAPS